MLLESFCWERMGSERAISFTGEKCALSNSCAQVSNATVGMLLLVRLFSFVVRRIKHRRFKDSSTMEVTEDSSALLGRQGRRNVGYDSCSRNVVISAEVHVNVSSGGGMG